jgi:hypothetical protein
MKVFIVVDMILRNRISKVTGADPSGHEDNDKLFQNTSFCDSLVEYFTTNVNKKNM